MATAEKRRKYLLIAGWTSAITLSAIGVIQSGNVVYYVDLSSFLFVLVGGIALTIVSFPGVELAHAIRRAVKAPENDEEIMDSFHFWEAAGRNLWLVGVMGSILHLALFFNHSGHPGPHSSGHPGEYAPSLQPAINEMAGYLLSALYGVLLAVICFTFCWRLAVRSRSRPLASSIDQGGGSLRGPGRTFRSMLGYIVFAFLLVSYLLKLYMPVPFLIAFKPAMFLVLGGTVALILLTRGANSKPTLSISFGVMGLIGFLIGAIQVQGHVAGAFAFILSSCLTALLGISLLSAPLEDRAVRTRQLAAPSTLSRAAWYGFPLLALIFLIPMFFLLFSPLPGPH